jgi:hypothetical protein
MAIEIAPSTSIVEAEGAADWNMLITSEIKMSHSVETFKKGYAEF